MQKAVKKETPYFFKRLKTYKPEEIVAAGGTTAFAKLTNYNADALYHLKGERISQDDLEKALSILAK